MIEFLCPRCKEWFVPESCVSHYSGSHDQQGVTFEKLQKRMSVMGGVDIRETDDIIENEQKFLTNNFEHTL